MLLKDLLVIMWYNITHSKSVKICIILPNEKYVLHKSAANVNICSASY